MQAAIVYEKLKDTASLVRLYVEGHHWDEVSTIITGIKFHGVQIFMDFLGLLIHKELEFLNKNCSRLCH